MFLHSLLKRKKYIIKIVQGKSILLYLIISYLLHFCIVFILICLKVFLHMRFSQYIFQLISFLHFSVSKIRSRVSQHDSFKMPGFRYLKRSEILQNFERKELFISKFFLTKFKCSLFILFCHFMIQELVVSFFRILQYFVFMLLSTEHKSISYLKSKIKCGIFSNNSIIIKGTLVRNTIPVLPFRNSNKIRYFLIKYV